MASRRLPRSGAAALLGLGAMTGRASSTRARRAAALVPVFLLTAGSGVAVAAPDAGVALARLQDWLDATRTLDCRFEQRFVSESLGSVVRETGRLRLLRPGRMRWDYDAPDPKVAVVKGDRTLLYLPEERQLVVGRLSDVEGILPGLLAGDRPLRDLFHASLVEPGGQGSGSAWKLRLEPRQPSEGVRAVLLTLHPRDHGIVAAEVVDSSGSRTEYVFRRVQRNRSVDVRVFDFTPPEGTSVTPAEIGVVESR